MKRVTEWRGEHAAIVDNHVNYIDRLAEYEDTGLEPQEINSLTLKIQSLEMSLKVACDALEKFTKAEQERRLVVLPCKVGDTVYRIWTKEGRLPVITEHYMKDLGMVVRWMHYFGNRVFLTREEAEQALQKAE